MKQTVLFFAFLFTLRLTFSQSVPPQGINYQAMVYVPYSSEQPGVNNVG